MNQSSLSSHFALEQSLSLAAFCQFQKLMHERTGVQLSSDKVYLVQTRLLPLLQQFELHNFDALYQHIAAEPQSELYQAVIDALTTHETSWFRDRSVMDVFESKLIPEWLAAFAAGRAQPLKIWSAACSTGEEAYSMAMLIHHLAEKTHQLPLLLNRVDILGSDISHGVVDEATMGIYGRFSTQKGLPEDYRSRYMRPVGEAFQVSNDIRSWVRFKQHNLLDALPEEGGFDAILLCNVTMYFSPDIKTQLMSRLQKALRPGGVLLIGSTELPVRPEGQTRLKQHHRCFYYQNQVE